MRDLNHCAFVPAGAGYNHIVQYLRTCVVLLSLLALAVLPLGAELACVGEQCPQTHCMSCCGDMQGMSPTDQLVMARMMTPPTAFAAPAACSAPCVALASHVPAVLAESQITAAEQILLPVLVAPEAVVAASVPPEPDPPLLAMDRQSSLCTFRI